MLVYLSCSAVKPLLSFKLVQAWNPCRASPKIGRVWPHICGAVILLPSGSDCVWEGLKGHVVVKGSLAIVRVSESVLK